jgi:hypothetical protein
MLDAVWCAYIRDGTVERGFGRRALGSEEAIHGEDGCKSRDVLEVLRVDVGSGEL